MNSRRLVGATLFAVAGLTMTAAVATTATVAATPAASATAIANAAATHQSNQTPSQVQAYWTTARRAAAREVAIPQVRASAVAAPKQTDLLGKKIAGGSTPQISLTRSTTPNAPLTPAIATPTISKSGIWHGHGKMPATTVGKLYFSVPGGSAECTASVINSNNRSMIWTAGHCTNDGNGNWYSNFEFVPDYSNGVQPLGVWTWKSASTPTAYLNGANQDYDFAAITLWPTSGVSVANATGWQGYEFNGGYVWAKTYEFGYPYDTHPARSGITGQDLRYCIGQTFQSGNQEAIQCDQGHGASGGPWLTDLLFPRGWGYLIGNVSHHNSDSSNVENGPHFGDAAVNVWNAQTNV